MCPLTLWNHTSTSKILKEHKNLSPPSFAQPPTVLWSHTIAQPIQLRASLRSFRSLRSCWFIRNCPRRSTHLWPVLSSRARSKGVSCWVRNVVFRLDVRHGSKSVDFGEWTGWKSLKTRGNFAILYVAYEFAGRSPFLDLLWRKLVLEVWIVTYCHWWWKSDGKYSFGILYEYCIVLLFLLVSGGKRGRWAVMRYFRVQCLFWERT